MAAVVGFYPSNGYQEVDPLTGDATYVAGSSGGLLNLTFAIDQTAGIAYRRDGSNLVTTNLVTGEETSITVASFPSQIGVYDHRLIGFYPSSGYQEIDPLTGNTTYVAGSSGGLLNLTFAIDQTAGIAYRRDGSNLVTTKLVTGEEASVDVSSFPSQIGINSIPEPQTTLCFVLGIGIVSMNRRRLNKLR